MSDPRAGGLKRLGGSPCRLLVMEDPEALAGAAARLFMDRAKNAVQERGQFWVAVSGGATPRPAYRLLAQEPYGSSRVWDRTHLFWVDERCVPKTDPASNWGTAQKDLLDRVPIPGGQIHPMPGTLPPEQGARQYEETLAAFFHLKQGDLPRFDLILLGVGGDGHMASLFPGQNVLNETERRVAAVKGGAPDVWRLTMTLPVLNHAREILFLVSGERKRDMITRLFRGEPSGLPVERVHPVAGAITWVLDGAAASGLPQRGGR
ncbi:MAG: 6-phosphogluconolactonase [Desulfobacteraceae bacterium]